MRSLDTAEMELRESINRNQFEMCVISVQDLQAVTRETMPRNKWKLLWQGHLKKTVGIGVNYYGTFKDTSTIGKALAELYRVSGTTPAQLKWRLFGSGFRSVIAIKGPSVKNIVMTLVRYSHALVNQLKSLNMTLGSQFTVNHITGFAVNMVLAVPLATVDTFLQDEPTWSYFLGNLASSFLKATVGTSIGMMLTGGAAIATLTLGKFVVVIFISLAVTVGLDMLDQKFHLTDKLVKHLGDLQEKFGVEYQSSLDTMVGMSQLKGNNILW